MGPRYLRHLPLNSTEVNCVDAMNQDEILEESSNIGQPGQHPPKVHMKLRRRQCNYEMRSLGYMVRRDQTGKRPGDNAIVMTTRSGGGWSRMR
jgi:hypothetical protein